MLHWPSDAALARTLTDERGGFRFARLVMGLYHLAVTARAGSVHFFDARPGRAARVSVPRFASIIGQVVDRAGKPVDGVFASVSPYRGARFRAGGRFGFAGVAPGDRTVAVAGAMGAAKARLRLHPGIRTRVDLVLSPYRHVRGRLLDDAGTPLPGWQVSVIQEDPLDRRQTNDFWNADLPGRVTGPDGRFEVWVAWTGPSTLRANRASHDPTSASMTWFHPIEIGGMPVVELGNLRMARKPSATPP
jgi:hypothetical protein